MVISLDGLISSFAAGNTVLLKPSEISQAPSKLLFDLLPKYLDPDAFAVLSGDGLYVQELLKNCRFDHVLFTGSDGIAKKVKQGLADSSLNVLTPTTLELGGKSPCFVTRGALYRKTVFGGERKDEVSFRALVRRLVRGKWMNAGQTCVAPDFAVVHKDVMKDFLAVRNLFFNLGILFLSPSFQMNLIFTM